MQSINLSSYITPVIAHRGASALAPENTLSAFRRAAEIGAKWVEFDVMLAACGEVVVIHDETLDRTTNGTGLVCDYPYKYLKTLDAGSWFNTAFRDEKIPTLKEVFGVLTECHLFPNIEIKPSLGNEEQTVKNVIAVTKQYWNANLPVLFSSFSHEVRRILRKWLPSGLLACLMHEWQEDWKKTSDELQCVAIDVNHTILIPERIHDIKSTGRLLLSYTIDDPIRAHELFSWGVDAIFSNCPPVMHEFF